MPQKDSFFAVCLKENCIRCLLDVSALQGSSHRQRLDKKQDCCPLEREELRVKTGGNFSQ